VLTTTTRQVAAGLAVLYAGAVAFTVFWPSADYASGSVNWMTDVLYGIGAPHWISGQLVEFLANILLFVPLSLLGSVLLDRWSTGFWLGIGFAASTAIELAQLVFLGDRSATVVDVLANTLGALLGAHAANALRPHLPDR
jgi:glycopeptide antibiotics resistance protein